MSPHINMVVGMKIAEKHKQQVLKMIQEFDATPEEGLDGCIVALASDIMVAIDNIEREKPAAGK